jgi:chromate reductase
LAHEAYVGGAASLFPEEGGVASDGTKRFLADLMTRFAAWVELTAG